MNQRGAALGKLATATYAGLTIGPLLAGLIMAKLSWHWIFFINVPIALLAIGLIAMWVPSSRDEHQTPLDPIGSLLSIAGLGSLVYALIEGQRPDGPDDDTPALVEVADNPDGPWQVITDRRIEPHPQGWHFGINGDGRFSGDSPTGYVRLSAKKGLKGVRMAAHYAPGEAPPDSPLEITHVWYEDDPTVGRRERRHVETTDRVDHEYVGLLAARRRCQLDLLDPLNDPLIGLSNRF